MRVFFVLFYMNFEFVLGNFGLFVTLMNCLLSGDLQNL